VLVKPLCLQVWLAEAQSSGIDTGNLELVQAMQNFAVSAKSEGGIYAVKVVVTIVVSPE
jgi:hypothetical protein